MTALIDIDVVILSKMERGERPLTKEVVQALANLYNYDLKELMSIYLSGKVIHEIGDEELALQALKVAEEQIAYNFSAKIDKEVVIAEFADYFQKCNYFSKAWIVNSLLDKYPYPWYKARAFRNFILHEYHAIEFRIVWDSTQKELPELKETVQQILRKEFLNSPIK